MSTYRGPASQVPVLIVGGGVVGLCTALLLQQHNVDFMVDFMLVERRQQPSLLPKARGLHARTTEIFRQLGIEDQIERAVARVLKAGKFGGARHGATILEAEPLEIMRPIGIDRTASPSRFCFLPQTELEPALRDIAVARGATLRSGTELTEFTANDDGITATLTDTATGELQRLNADYLIAADGASSPIRTALGIDSWQLPPTHHYLNVFFRADLAELIADRTFSQCQIANETLSGLVLAKNNTDEWSLHIEYDPNREDLDDYPPARCAELARKAIGADLDVEVLARSAWDTGVAVANRYRVGRVFLVGDAAHRHAPWGGFGANTGVADAHNLVWKLAAVIAGHADPTLLDSYQDERRPRAVVAAEQARLRTDFHTRYSVATPDNRAELAQLLDLDAVMSRYRYTTALDDSHVAVLSGQPGTRIPHLWLRRGDNRVSTLDLCGPGFTILTDLDAAAWADAAHRVQTQTGVPVAVCVIGRDVIETDVTDPDSGWRAGVAMADGGALLVRPDQHVLARSDQNLRPDSLAEILSRCGASSARPATPSGRR